MVANALLCVAVASASISTFGDAHERTLRFHESRSGVRQSIETIARMASDGVLLAPMPICFCLAFEGLSNFAAGLSTLIPSTLLYLVLCEDRPH